MQKCRNRYMESNRMDQDRVKLFVRKLEDLSISDYYGLKSPGLTCYLNSVLQVLFMTADFREAVKRCCSKHSAPLDPHLRELFCYLERRNAETHDITEQLGITDVYEQRDAAEYFEKILCRSSSEASKIFKGELNHKTTCCECNKTNDSRSFFWVLPLSMDTSSCESYSVLHGLEDFFKVQKVSEENQMFCNSCNKKQDADTKYELTRSPDVLTLLLKRFTFDYRRSRYIKLQCEADVVRTLNLQNCRYDLYAVVHHCGYLTGGHYTADIKSFETGNWYCFNDDTVKSVMQKYAELENNSMRSSTAYLLMYRKDTEAEGQQQDAKNHMCHVNTEKTSDVHVGTNSSERTFLQNFNSVVEGQILSKSTEKQYNVTKIDVSYQNPTRNRTEQAAAVVGIQDNSMKLSEETYVSDVGYSTLKTRDVYSPASSATRCSCNLCRAEESSFKINRTQKQPVVAAGNKYQTLKTVRKGKKTVSPTEKRRVKKS